MTTLIKSTSSDSFVSPYQRKKTNAKMSNVTNTTSATRNPDTAVKSLYFIILTALIKPNKRCTWRTCTCISDRSTSFYTNLKVKSTFSVDYCYDVYCEKGYYCDKYTGYCGMLQKRQKPLQHNHRFTPSNTTPIYSPSCTHATCVSVYGANTHYNAFDYQKQKTNVKVYAVTNTTRVTPSLDTVVRVIRLPLTNFSFPVLNIPN